MSARPGGRWDEDIDWTDLPSRAVPRSASSDPEIRREAPRIEPTEELPAAADPRPASPSPARPPMEPRPRTVRVGTAVAVGVGCLIVGGALGYVARGGAPQAKPATLTQTIPQVTVTERATP